jgi:hypothetical protein
METVMSKWIYFDQHENKKGRKTKIWFVRAKDGDQYLGTVAWYPAWRKYVFWIGEVAEGGVLFEQDCLRDIADFIETRTREHYQAIRDAKRMDECTDISCLATYPHRSH